MSETEPIPFADFVNSRVTALYRHALVLTHSPEEAEKLVETALIRTGLEWREAMLSDPENHARSVMDRLAAAPPPDVPEEITALAAAPSTHAPPELAHRVARGLVDRRRRNRNRRLAIAAGLAVVLPAAFGISALRGDHEPPAAAPTELPSPAISRPPPMLSAPTAPAGLDAIIARARAVRLPMRQPDGTYFRAEALAPNGSIVGGTGLDFDPYRATDGLVWLLGPEAGRRVAVTQPPPHQPWAHAIGRTVLAWAEERAGSFELFCADPTAAAPVPRQVSRNGVATSQRPVHASGDVVVWTDENDAVQWVRGCTGTPQALPVTNVLGVAYPEVFYADRGTIRALNLESNQAVDVSAMPGAPDPGRVAFAGNRSYLAWTIGDALLVLDRRGGAPVVVSLPQLPGTAGGRICLTMGDRVVAFAMRQPESDVEYGFVYDIPGRNGLRMPTEVFASGDRLLWREEITYLVAPV